ncbi:hypothetical protein TH4_12700 [Thalassospira tepidiphila MCCC 1A03514]|uniref:Uncharacterized protein n=1 Tax=Thalassospira tepidiphila MCCC 1A03514 TaxID=1177930 RepID=A0A853KZG7_9PROT|nr:hypothetical protein TH4_12700 [Thalassospira tepidiphila MCCC 1A03514]
MKIALLRPWLTLLYGMFVFEYFDYPRRWSAQTTSSQLVVKVVAVIKSSNYDAQTSTTAGLILRLPYLDTQQPETQA